MKTHCRYQSVIVCGRFHCVPDFAKETEHNERIVDRKNITSMMMVAGDGV